MAISTDLDRVEVRVAEVRQSGLPRGVVILPF